MSLRVGASLAKSTCETWQLRSSRSGVPFFLPTTLSWRVFRYRSTTNAALGTSNFGRTNTRLRAVKLPSLPNLTLGDCRINSTTVTRSTFAPDARISCSIDRGPALDESGKGRPEPSKNFGSENHVAIIAPISSYVRTRFLYRRSARSDFRGVWYFCAKSTISSDLILFCSRNSKMAASNASAPC